MNKINKTTRALLVRCYMDSAGTTMGWSVDGCRRNKDRAIVPWTKLLPCERAALG